MGMSAATVKKFAEARSEVFDESQIMNRVVSGPGIVTLPAEIPDPRTATVRVPQSVIETVAGMADGIRCDMDGNVWVGAGWVGPGYDGVHIFSSEGERIGLILLP